VTQNPGTTPPVTTYYRIFPCVGISQDYCYEGKTIYGDAGPFVPVSGGTATLNERCIPFGQGCYLVGWRYEMEYYSVDGLNNQENMHYTWIYFGDPPILYTEGGAYLMVGGYRASISVNKVTELNANTGQSPAGSLNFIYRSSTTTCYLGSTSITSVAHSGDSTSSSWVIQGIATVNNQPGYSFTVTATAKGGAGLDQFGIEVRDPRGNVFFSCPLTTISGGHFNTVGDFY